MITAGMLGLDSSRGDDDRSDLVNLSEINSEIPQQLQQQPEEESKGNNEESSLSFRSDDLKSLIDGSYTMQNPNS